MQAPNETSAVRRAYDVLRAAANAQPYPDAEVREDRLTRLEQMLLKYENELVQAMSDDFGFRQPMEARTSDILIPLDTVRMSRAHVREWMQRRFVNVHPFSLPSQAFVEPIPLGVVAVISPWNYPVLLAISPLAAAIAAGNRAILKPSELTPKTSALLAKAIGESFKPDELVVLQGGPEVAREVTALPLDHLFFTGSTQVGRLVAKAAADNLVPTTLELGGKSPALVHESFNLDRAAARVAMGKTFNAGQTCIGCDYALVPKGKVDSFVAKVKERLLKQHPQGAGLTTLASERGFKRMEALVADAKAKGAKVIETAPAAALPRAFPPLILTDVTDDMLVMQEEIFGPLLPIVPYERFDDAIAYINARPRPLALYYFDDDVDRTDSVLRRIPSGGVCVNDVLVHIAQEELPFGGVGASGMGAYHGVKGFETFSHMRGVMHASRLSAAYNFLTPPFPSIANKAVGFLIKGLRGLSS